MSHACNSTSSPAVIRLKRRRLDAQWAASQELGDRGEDPRRPSASASTARTSTTCILRGPWTDPGERFIAACLLKPTTAQKFEDLVRGGKAVDSPRLPPPRVQAAVDELLACAPPLTEEAKRAISALGRHAAVPAAEPQAA